MEEVKLILPFKTDVIKKDEVECSLVTLDDNKIFYVRHTKRYVDNPFYKLTLIGGESIDVNHRYIKTIQYGTCVKLCVEVPPQKEKKINLYYFVLKHYQYTISDTIDDELSFLSEDDGIRPFRRSYVE